MATLTANDRNQPGQRSLFWASLTEFLSVLVVWFTVPWVVGMGTRVGPELLLPALTAASITTLVLRNSRSSIPMAVSQVDDVRHVANTSALSGAAAVMVALLLDQELSATAVILSILISGVVLLCVRGVNRRLRSRFGTDTNVVVIGAGLDATEISELLIDHPEARLNLVGVIGHGPTAVRNGLEPLWLGDTSDLDRILQEHNVTAAIVLPTGFRAESFRRVLTDLASSGIEPLLSTGVARLGASSLKINSLVHEPLIRLDSSLPRRRPAMTLVRLIDIVGSIVLLTFSAPLILIAAIAIKAEDRGPVFYRSQRVGVDNEPFGMLKLRSMAPDADERKNELANRNERSGPLFKVTNDPRITRVGKILRETSIDEIPQFINVLIGDMSLVGPRPALPEEASEFDTDLQSRFNVRPGITGLWQVEARNNASFEAYRRLDLRYINSRSLILDLQILVATAAQVSTSIVMIPISLFFRTERSDGVQATGSVPQASSVIDLRDRAEAKFTAHSSGTTRSQISQG